VVSVLNLQSKRTISGVVTGRGQVTISSPPSRLPAPETTSSLGTNETDKETVKPVSIAANATSPAIPQVASKAE
jgi:flagella basal body P-ring formation protein FlgA